MLRLVLVLSGCFACATSRPVTEPEPVDRLEVIPSRPPSDTLEQSDVLSGVAAARTRFAACASSHRARNGPRERLIAKWRITTAGTTADITLPTPSTDKETNECVVGVLETLRFPAHRAEGEPVMFPFNL